MSQQISTDVLIVGAGPGGCAAALSLAKQGTKALLVDRTAFPRDKVCGDALSGKVMRVLDRLAPDVGERLRADARQQPSWGVTFTAPGGRSLRVPFGRYTGRGDAPGAIMPRLDFDALLVEKVRKAPGIELIEGATVKDFERTTSGWCVSDAAKRLTIHARLVIAADGANSHFARHVAGLELEPRHHCAGIRAYFENVQGLDPDGFIELIFLKELLPGYLWIFPLPGGRANVGLGLRSDMVRDRRLDLKAMLRALLTEHPRLKERFKEATHTGGIQGLGLPLASRRRILSGDGYLLVGDAGHLIDPFTGEGISHAMISGSHAGEVAAEALVRTRERPNRIFLGEYDVRVWRRLGKELSISTKLQRLAAFPWLFDLVVNRAAKNPVLAETISSMFNDLDMRSRLRSPSFYAKLLFG